MTRPKILPAFTSKERIRVHALLASRVAAMMGRKFEEGDWSYAYCAGKQIPERGWSNLNIDVIHNGLGVEHKMLCVSSNKNIKEYCGTSLMHPAATRSVRIPSIDEDPTETAHDVLRQYAELIEQRRSKVAESNPSAKPEMRTGWLLWQESLREFLYFEEEMLPPNPDNYWAEWKESGGGARKASRNLWVYEKETGRKRYSITTSAGAKIQPYFDVPSPKDPHLYYFRVQGEEIKRGVVRIWITSNTAILLRHYFANLDKDFLSSAILNAAQEVSEIKSEGEQWQELEIAEAVLITASAYTALTEKFAGVSDEHMVQLFVRYVSQR